MIMDAMVLVWFDGVHASTVILFYLVSVVVRKTIDRQI